MPKTISGICPSGCSDRIPTSTGTRCLIGDIRNLTLMLRKVIRGSLRTQRKRTRRFLFNASCLIFFYYYVQRFFYTKKLNAVLINSVCSFNWGSFKSEDFVRNSAKPLFFLILWNCWFFVSAMKLYSLTVGRLHILLSIKLAFHYIYFILLFYFFLPKDESYLFEIWDTMFNLVYLFKFLPTWCGNPSLDITTLRLRLVRMTCKSYGFHYQKF